MSDTTWVVLADSSRARILRTDAALTEPPEVVAELVNPAGRLRESELVEDGGHSRGSGPGARSDAGTPSARDTEVERFAKQIADILADARRARRYDGIVLAAPPKFLGQLRRQLDPVTLQQVHTTIDKELVTLPEHAILDELQRRVA